MPLSQYLRPGHDPVFHLGSLCTLCNQPPGLCPPCEPGLRRSPPRPAPTPSVSPLPARPRPPRALTTSGGSLSLLRAGGAGWSCVGSSLAGSAGGRVRLRLPPEVGSWARSADLAGLGVRQFGLARKDAARGPGRRRKKKSVTRRCAMARREPGSGSQAAGAPLQEPGSGRKWRHSSRRFSRHAWPRPLRRRNHRRRGDGKWTRPGACALVLSAASAARTRHSAVLCAGFGGVCCIGLRASLASTWDTAVPVDTKPVQYGKTI